MMRYVLAVILTGLIMAISIPAVNHAAGLNGEKQVTRAISEIDEAATSLYKNEDIPPRGHPGPRRVVSVQFPRDTLESNPLTFLRIRRVTSNRSVATYKVKGRATSTYHIPAPIVNKTGDPVTIAGTGEQTYVLYLKRDDKGNAVVVLRRM